MLIVALILAVIGLAALVAAVVTSNELIAWVCIGASGLGVLLLVVDAVRDRANRRSEGPADLAAAPEATTPEETTPEETTEVIAAVAVPDTVDGDVPDTAEYAEEYAEEYARESAADDLVVEDHPDELVYDEPDHDTFSDDEADYPEPAEEAAVHVVGEGYLGDESVDVSAPEIRYITGPEGSHHTVVYSYSESAETEYIDNGDSPVRGDRGDR